MSKFIYKGTLNEKYISGTILSDNIEANKISVNTLDSTREDINILKNVDIDGDLSVSGSVNADFDLSTIKTNTITSDNNSIDINKSINTNGISNTGNITNAGNITATGSISSNSLSTGDITSSGNFTNTGNITATGSISSSSISSNSISSTGNIECSNIKLDNTNKKVKVNNSNVWDNYICDGQGTLIGKDGTGSNGEIFNDYTYNTASGNYSHAEGSGTIASGSKAHAEGNSTQATGMNAHTEGSLTYATNSNAHAEGTATRASAISSHSGGSYTIASQENEMVIGTYNIDETGQTTNKLFVIGNGDAINRNDVFFVKSTGEIEGDGTITAKNGSNKIKLDPSTNKIKISSDNGTNWTDYSTGNEGVGKYGTGANAEIFNNYSNNTASGDYSHAEGYITTASNDNAHAEGNHTKATGICSHAEGYATEASGHSSHAGGYQTVASQEDETVIGRFNIDETGQTTNKLFVIGNGAANNKRNDAFYVKSDGESFINGQLLIQNETDSNTPNKTVFKIDNHEIINNQDAIDNILNIKQNKDVVFNGSDVSGFANLTVNNKITTQNLKVSNDAFTNNLYVSGTDTNDAKVKFTGSSETLDIKTSSGNGTFNYNGKITGPSYETNNYIVSKNGNDGIRLNGTTKTIQTTTDGTNWSNISFGSNVGQNYYVSSNLKGEIFNDYSNNTAAGDLSHAENYLTTASGAHSHAEGENTTSSGSESHAEGKNTIASAQCSHAEGDTTTASGGKSHAEGYNSTASGYISHAEGEQTHANSSHSHTSGYYTIASQSYQTVVGKFNVDDTGSTTDKLFVVGNGTANNSRNDAFIVKNNGETIVNGTLIIHNGNKIIKIVPDDLQIKSSSDGGSTWNTLQLL